MKSWLPYAIALSAAICVGVGTGYVAAFLRAGTNSLLVASPTGDSFQQVYMGMGRLNALDILASNCEGKGDIRPTSAKEEGAIQNLRQAENEIGSAAPIDVAESIVAVRAAVLAEEAKDSSAHFAQEARAQKLLEAAGWRDPSAARMRQVIIALDQERCGRSSTKGEGAR